MTIRATIHRLLGSAFLLGGCPRGSGSTYVPGSEVPATNSREGSMLEQKLWETFLAINWPAANSGRGAPCPQNPKDSTDPFFTNLEAPRVWETWKQDFEVDGWHDAELTDWNKYDTSSIPCDYIEIKKEHIKELCSMNSAPSPVEGTEDVFSVPRQCWPELYPKLGGTVLNGVNTFKRDPGDKEPYVESGPVIDVAGEYVRSEIRYNQAVYDHLRGQGRTQQGTVVVLPEVVKDKTAGSITLKASWRKITGGRENFKRYYTRTLLVVDYMKDPSDGRLVSVCRPQESALVGLHIVYKLDNTCASKKECRSANRCWIDGKCKIVNSWAWATFEHVDNTLPCSEMSNAMPKGLGFISALEEGFSYEPDPVNPVDLIVPHSGHAPVMLCRKHEYRDGKKKYQKIRERDTPWGNYEMTGLQWPSFAEGSSPGNRVANVTLEPYAQEYSCMQCHKGKTVEKTDFVWSLAPPQ